MRAESHSVVHSNPETSGGTPVFRGTRVPVRSLFDYLEGGEMLCMAAVTVGRREPRGFRLAMPGLLSVQ